MTLAAVVSPYLPINGLTGLGLNDGALYIGVDGMDPQTNPQQCYWDAAATIPAAQPIQILGGYPMRLGTPTRLYTGSTYSIRVRDASGSQVFYEAHAVPAATGAGVFASRVEAAASFIPVSQQGVGIELRGYATAGDGGGGFYRSRLANPGHPAAFQSADGAWWELVADRVYPAQLGAAGDGVTDDLPEFKNALAAAVALKVPLVVVDPHYFFMSVATDPIRLPSNTHIIFEGGSVEWGCFGIPCFWAESASNIRLETPKVYWSGAIAAALPAVNGVFYNTVLARPGPHAFPTRDIMAAFLLAGVDTVHIDNAEIYSRVLTNTTLVNAGIVVLDGNAGALSTNIHITNFQIDGHFFGIVAWGFDGLYVDGFTSDHFGQPSTATYPWAVACHAIYCTAQVASKHLRASNFYDVGTPVAGWDNTVGACAFKFRMIDLVVENLYSLRPSGLLDFIATTFRFSGLYWRSNSGHAADYAPTRILRGTTLTSYGSISDVWIEIPADNDAPVIEIGDDQPTFGAKFCRFSDITLVYEGVAQSIFTPFILAGCSYCEWEDISLVMPNLAVANQTLARVDGGGSYNHFELSVLGSDPATARVAVNVPAVSVANSVQITNAITGEVRWFSDRGGDYGIKTKYLDVPLAAGASVSLAGFIPDGALLMGLTTYNRVAVGLSAGATGYNVGDGVSAFRWGQNGTALNSTTDCTNWIDGSIKVFTAAQDVILTAVGGNFDGAGVVRVTLTYFMARTSELERAS